MLPNPLALIAEITHRCPLHCVYCSNPLQMASAKSELSTDEWARVFEQAGKMGMLHVHLTGGEPVARSDLRDLVTCAHAANLYTNLITSGVGLSEQRLAEIVSVGLDHIQLSFQDSREEAANWIAGARAHQLKLDLARAIRKHPIAFTVNLVVHRQNLDQLSEMISFLEQLQPDRMEIAHAQYYGWALKNRTELIPTREQLDRAMSIVAEAERRLSGKIRVDSVVPDYYARYPKACMGGWGRRFMLIEPSGKVLPCHAAAVIPGMQFDSVRDRPLDWIWRESSPFQRFRGEAWMPEPCRSCDRRTEDFGGCRCQAFLLTGNATATDPACSLAFQHEVVEAVLSAVNAPPAPTLSPAQTPIPWAYRANPE